MRRAQLAFQKRSPEEKVPNVGAHTGGRLVRQKKNVDLGGKIGREEGKHLRQPSQTRRENKSGPEEI